jgi:adenylate cyclase
MDEARRLAAIMFTDIVGYSGLSQRNEPLALELLDEHRRLLRPLFAAHGGSEVKTIGDAFLVEFPSAVEAVRCAVALQDALRARNAGQPPERRVEVRVGLHVGDVVHKEGDIYGDGVNIASRVQPLAPPGGICFSDQVYVQVRNKLDAPVIALGRARLKNIEAPLPIYAVLRPGQKASDFKLAPQVALSARRRVRAVAVPAAVVVLIALIGLVFGKRLGLIGPGPETARSLAVLPLRNLSGNADQDYFADGLTEALITELSKIKALLVISRTSVMRYKETTKSLPEIAKELKVGRVVEGAAVLAAAKAHLEARLVEAKTEKPLFAEQYERDLGDIFVLQGELARTLARKIGITITPDEDMRLARNRTLDPAASEAYLKGRFFLNKFTAEGIQKAIELFQEALAKEPGYGLAYASLAEAYDTLIALGGLTPESGWPLVKASAEKALAADDGLAEAYAMLGDYYFISEWNWAEADKAYRKAVELNPSYALGQNWYGMFLLSMGQFDEALERVTRAKTLDPLSTQNVNLGLVYYFSGRCDQAVREFQDMLSLDPNFAVGRLNLAKAYLEKKMYDKAIEEFKRADALEGGSGDSAGLAHAYAAAGRTAEARTILDKLLKARAEANISPDRIALVYAGLGDKDRAFEWLGKAVDERAYDMVMLKVEPRFAPLRSDPRFGALLKRMGL